MNVRTVLAILALATAGFLVATPAQAAVARCSNADLKATYRPLDNAAGHRYGLVVLTNRSTHACSTGGFGGISYVGHGDGTQIGAAADRVGGWSTYVVRPGQRVHSLLDRVSAQNYPASRCRPVHVDGLRVYVPNATRSQFVPLPTTGCANAAVHLLSHHSYVR